VAKKIFLLDTVICRPIEKRVKLSAGDKIEGSIDIIGREGCSTYLTILTIYKLMEAGKEIVYETPVLELWPSWHWDISFMVSEDGEYLIKIESSTAFCCIKIQLYLEREAEDRTVLYDS